jgi:hypothetical protein
LYGTARNTNVTPSRLGQIATGSGTAWPGPRRADVLDRIDQINPPGVTINHADNGWTQPAPQPTKRRR